MKLLKTLLRSLVFFIGFLLILVLVPLGVLLFRPEKIPYDWILKKWAAPFLQSQGLNWSQARLQLRSLSFTRKEIELNLTYPCFFSASDPPQKKWVNACFDSARTRLTADLSLSAIRRRAFFEKVSTFDLLGGKVQVSLQGASAPTPPASRPSAPSKPPQFPSWLSHTQIASARIEIPKWKILDPKSRLIPAAQGHFRLLTRQTRLQWEAGAALPRKTRIALNGTLIQSQAKDESPFHGTLEAKASRLRHWSHRILGETIPIDRLEARRCRFELDPSRRAHLSCDIEALLKYIKPGPQDESGTLFFNTFGIHQLRPVLAALETEWTWGEKPAQGSGHLTIQPLNAGPAMISGIVDADFLPDGSIPLRFETQVKIPDFQKTAYLLRNTDWAVPAPLNILSGQLTLDAAGNTDTRTFYSIRMHLATDLNSPASAATGASSRLNLDSNGTLDFKKTGKRFLSDLKVQTLLSNVQLPLPSLALKSPPALLPDSRFTSFAEEEARKTQEPSLFRYHLSFVTPGNHPVRLISNLAKAKVPLLVNLDLSRDSLVGSIRAESFPLELFRRNARVENLLVGFEPSKGGPGEHPLQCMVRVEYVDYIVTIQFTGTLEKPIMNLSSSPPLAQDRLIAVLFFGQPLEELAPDQAISVGEAKAALANGAINFVSLYLLASTPIQSINYDPRSGVFTAKLRLGPGASLNIGADPNELQSIELQKRIGPNWVVTTEVTDPTTSEKRQLQAFLEWIRRY